MKDIARQTLTYFRQLCSSLNPKTSLIFLFVNGASHSPISLVIGVSGQTFCKYSFVGTFVVIVSLVALKIWYPNPSFFTQRSQICPKSYSESALLNLNVCMKPQIVSSSPRHVFAPLSRHDVVVTERGR